MTVSEIQPLLERFVGPSGTVTDEQFLTALNQVRERYINSGKWKDMVVEEDVTPVDGIIELPAHCESILGAQFDGLPVVVFGRQHEFVPGGPGEVTPGLGGAPALIDQGDRTYKIMGSQSVTSVKLTCKIRYTELTGPSVTSPTGNLVLSNAGVTAANGVYEKVGTSPNEKYVHRTAPYEIRRAMGDTQWYLYGPNEEVLYSTIFNEGSVSTDLAPGSWQVETIPTGSIEFDGAPAGNGVYIPYAGGWALPATSYTLRVDGGVPGVYDGEVRIYYGTAVVGGAPVGPWRAGYNDELLSIQPGIALQTSTAASPVPTVTAETSTTTADETVIPANFGALKLGLQALGYENENDLERSKVYWMEGYTLLNDQTRQARGAAQTVLQQSPHAFNPGRLRALY